MDSEFESKMKQDEKCVMTKEVAEMEFDRWVDAMDLDLDPEHMNGEDRADLEKLKRLIIRQLMRGNLILDDNENFVYTPHRPNSRHKEPITFHERAGSSILATNGKKKNYEASKMYAMMAEMCRVDQSVFAKLCGTDIKVCEAIFVLLMD